MSGAGGAPASPPRGGTSLGGEEGTLKRLARLYRLARRLHINGLADHVYGSLYVYIVGSGLRVSPRGYATLVVLAPAVAAILVPAVAVALRLPVMYWAPAAILAPILLGATLFLYPLIRYRSRGDRLEPRILMLEMFLLSSILTSHNYYEALEKVYKRAKLVGFDVEFEEALRRIATGEKDVPSSLSHVASITPSRSLRSLLDGLRGIMESGLGIVEYIQWSISSHYGDVEARYRAALNSLSTIMEIFMAFAVLAPVLGIIAIITLYGLGGVIAAPPVNPRLLAGAVTFIVSPLSAAISLILVDTIMSRLKP